MSEKSIGPFEGAVIILILAIVFFWGSLWGELSMEKDCQHYGKHVDNQETYICEKQK